MIITTITATTTTITIIINIIIIITDPNDNNKSNNIIIIIILATSIIYVIITRIMKFQNFYPIWSQRQLYHCYLRKIFLNRYLQNQTSIEEKDHQKMSQHPQSSLYQWLNHPQSDTLLCQKQYLVVMKAIEEIHINNKFVLSARCVLGSVRNDDGDVNENGKKAIELH